MRSPIILPAVCWLSAFPSCWEDSSSGGGRLCELHSATVLWTDASQVSLILTPTCAMWHSLWLADSRNSVSPKQEQGGVKRGSSGPRCFGCFSFQSAFPEPETPGGSPDADPNCVFRPPPRSKTSRSSWALQNTYIPLLRYFSSTAATSNHSFLFCFSNYDITQLREKRTKGDNETGTGVSAQTGTCVHCQPWVTEKNKPPSPSPGARVSGIAEGRVPSTVSCGVLFLVWKEISNST